MISCQVEEVGALFTNTYEYPAVIKTINSCNLEDSAIKDSQVPVPLLFSIRNVGIPIIAEGREKG